jgi:hypothetical protein
MSEESAALAEKLRKIVSIALYKHIEEKYLATREVPEASYHVSMLEEAPVSMIAVVERPGEDDPIVLVQAIATTSEPANAEVSFREIKIGWPIYQDLAVALGEATSRTCQWLQEHTCQSCQHNAHADTNEDRDEDEDEEDEEEDDEAEIAGGDND